MKYSLKMAFIALIATLFVSSCGTFSDETDPYNAKEAAKDLSGVWRLKTVTRNNVDITSQIDFSQFRLRLNADCTYTIDNYLPFIVFENGTWGIDNPQYPFLLSFKEASASASLDVELSYPVVDGKRALSITHSPGCYSNSYTYVM